MQLQKCWISGISTVCCFCLMLALLSFTAFAAEAGDEVNFAEKYGLELADGERKRVTFSHSSGVFSMGLNVTNATTVANLVDALNDDVFNYGLTAFYDSSSGQFITIDNDGNKAGFEVSLDGKVLTPKPSVSSPVVSTPTMTDTLSTISNVMTAVFGWVVAVANAIVRNSILLLVVVIGFIGTGIALFRRVLRM